MKRQNSMKCVNICLNVTKFDKPVKLLLNIQIRSKVVCDRQNAILINRTPKTKLEPSSFANLKKIFF